MGCPDCGCDRFYIKSPDDEYEVFECGLKEGKLVFDHDTNIPEVGPDTVIYCDHCAWHGKLQGIWK